MFNGKTVAKRRSAQPEGGRPAVHLVGGTRPEAIKLAPVATAIRAGERLESVLVASGQHPVMFERGLAAFGLTPDTTLRVSRSTGSQPELASGLMRAFETHFTESQPAAVVVQGDTTTAFVAAMVAFWHRIPVVHLEAGLRSGDLALPFPEEANRSLVGRIAALHLAPTARAAANLARESVTSGPVLCVGNTVVDAAETLVAAHGEQGYRDKRLSAVEYRARRGSRRLVLATGHRRESWGEPMERVLRAVATIAETHPDVEVVFPTHPSPAVSAQVHAALDGCDRVTVTEPLDYPELLRLLSVSTLVCSDSGGIQEEAPTFGVPVLVTREVTERVEAIEAGTAVLVGTDEGLIVSWAAALLAGERVLARTGNPFGDGRAGARVEHSLAWLLGLTAAPPAPFDFSADAFAASEVPADAGSREAVGVS